MARILVVEDNRLNMELVTDLLRSAGHQVRQAFTAEAGIRMAGLDCPDLIVMDIRLPKMSGYDAVQALKDDPTTQRIPILALTAQAMRGDDHAAAAAGFDGYLTKPIDTKTLFAEIARLLG